MSNIPQIQTQDQNQDNFIPAGHESSDTTTQYPAGSNGAPSNIVYTSYLQPVNVPFGHTSSTSFLPQAGTSASATLNSLAAVPSASFAPISTTTAGATTTTFNGAATAGVIPQMNLDVNQIKHERSKSLDNLSDQMKRAREHIQYTSDSKKHGVITQLDMEQSQIKASVDARKMQAIMMLDQQFQEQKMQIEKTYQETRMPIELNSQQLLMQAKQQKMQMEQAEKMNRMQSRFSQNPEIGGATQFALNPMSTFQAPGQVYSSSPSFFPTSSVVPQI